MQSALETEIKMGLRYVVVDFDHTICATQGLFDLGEPMPGAMVALQTIKDMGLGIIVQSCRTSPGLSHSKTMEERLQQRDIMTNWMLSFNIPFDEIDDGSNGKRFGLCYIDDRGVPFQGDWSLVLQQVKTFKERASGG